jgi:hypothetical protein
MKNIIPISTALLLLLSLSSLGGTETRIAAFGSENNLLIDDTNIDLYPSCLERFTERIIVEHGFYPHADSLAYLAFYKEIGRFGNLGIVVNKTGTPLLPGTSAQTMVAQPEAVVRLYYAIRVRDAVSIGVGGGYGIAAMNDDEEGTTGDVTNESSVTSGRVSLTYLFGNAGHFIELGGGAETYAFQYKQGDNFVFENDNDMATSLNARLFYNLNEYVSFVPYVSYGTLDLSSKETAGAALSNVKRVHTTTKAGAGFNLLPFEENRVIIGIAYRQTAFELSDGVSDSTVTVRAMPEVFGGIESLIRSWLVLRAGLVKSLCIEQVELQNGIRSEYTTKRAPFDLALGCGLRFGSFEFDGVFHKDFAYTGGYLLSGKEDPVFTRISATYRF